MQAARHTRTCSEKDRARERSIHLSNASSSRSTKKWSSHNSFNANNAISLRLSLSSYTSKLSEYMCVCVYLCVSMCVCVCFFVLAMHPPN